MRRLCLSASELRPAGFLVLLNVLTYFYLSQLSHWEISKVLLFAGVTPGAFPSLQILPSLFLATFIHAGWFHVLIDSFFLFLFALLLQPLSPEPRLASFIPAYIVAGASANFFQWLSGGNSETVGVPLVGSCGAVTSLAAVLIRLLVRNLKLSRQCHSKGGPPVPSPALSLVLCGAWLLASCLTKHLYGPSVSDSMASHAGGFLAGWLLWR
jgi:membrane associated rhomboid family serine protease